MIKRIPAAVIAFTILLSLCACTAEKPEETTPEQTTGGETQDTTGAQESQEPIKWLTYEEYLALTPEQQQTYYKRFSCPEEYMVWFNAVAKEHSTNSNNSTQVEGNEGHITQPTEPETAPVPETTTPLQNGGQTTQKPTAPITPEITAPELTAPEKEMPVLLTYEEYMALSPALQQAYYESFPSVEAYMQWFNEAAKEYNNSKNDNSAQVEGNEGQITQPPEPDDTVAQPTEETKADGNTNLDGVGEVIPEGDRT